MMESKAKIRRLHFVEGYSIGKLVRETQISRNTIRGIIRSERADIVYQRSEQPTPKLGAFKDTLEQWLERDHLLPRKQRCSAMKYHTLLVEINYPGAYDSVQRFVKNWRKKHKESSSGYVPLYFAPGEAYQFDWSEEVIELGGIIQKIKVAQFRLCYSRKCFLIAYMRESQEMLFDAHNRAFEFFGGLTRRGIYDNMKTAVDVVFIGKNRVFNRRFLSLMDHYLIEPTACSPAAGWEKGQVENQVANTRDWIFSPRLKVASLDQLNQDLASQCQSLAADRHHPEQKEQTIEEVFQQEKGYLRLLGPPFEGYSERVCQVNSICLIHFDRNRYSVDCAYANQTVTLKVYATLVEVFAGVEQIASHPREFSRDKTLFNPWHYLPLLERKPGALRNGAPFKEWKLPSSILQVKNILMKRKGGDRECVDVLLAMTVHGIEAVGVACELALSDKVVARDYILNALSRLRPTPIIELLITPLLLKLEREPLANCQQYNSLLMEHTYVTH